MIPLRRILCGLVREAQFGVYWPKTELVQGVPAHRALYDAPVSGDPERAAFAMRNHVERMVDVVRRVDDEYESPT